jgi:hypothetical protein
VTSPEHHNTYSGGETSRNVDGAPHAVVLPPPFTDEEEDKKFANSRGVVFLGPSAIFLEPIRLSGSTANGQGGDDGEGDDATVRAEASQEFDLSYVPLVKGFSGIGGLRVILIEDQLVDEDRTILNDAGGGLFSVDQNDTSGVRRSTEVRILKEWDTIGEIWVKT